MISAAAISRAALSVSSSGSPGPAPTSQTGWCASRCGMDSLPCGCEQLGEGRAARSAIGACAERLADRGDIGQPLSGDRLDDRAQADVEADADDRAAIFLRPGRPTGEDGGCGS